MAKIGREETAVIIKCAEGRSIRLTQSLLERLVIIDDGMCTYNAYKSKFFKANLKSNIYRQHDKSPAVD